MVTVASTSIDREIEQMARQEATFRKDYPLAWAASFVGPIVVTCCVLILIGALNEWSTVGRVVLAALATFFIFGRFVILLGRDATVPLDAIDEQAAEYVRFLSSGELATMVTYLDVMTALFVAFHIGILFRLPWIGPRLAQVAADAHFILSIQPWMRRATFLGLVLFVIFPTSTTGSIGGSIFGRLLGLTKVQTLLAIFIGSIAGNGIMFAFSERLKPLKQFLQDSLPAQIIGLTIVIIVIVMIERWFRSLKKKYLNES